MSAHCQGSPSLEYLLTELSRSSFHYQITSISTSADYGMQVPSRRCTIQVLQHRPCSTSRVLSHPPAAPCNPSAVNHHHLLLAPSSLHAHRTHYAASHLPPHLTPLVTIFTGATGSLAINSQILIALQFLQCPPASTISMPIQHCTRNRLDSHTSRQATIHNPHLALCRSYRLVAACKARLALLSRYIIIPTCHLSASPLLFASSSLYRLLASC
ncbi:hypothetical protein HDV64DRAFT_76769 [Trichoderma sp. TUCIM 5745]